MKRNRVLFVDDQTSFTMLCALWLKAAGPFVTCEENCGSSAVATAKSFRPDLIFLDLHLPGKTGLEIAAELRTDDDFASIPIILLTGSITNEEAAEKQKLGIPALAKPILGCQLVSTALEFLCEQATTEAVAVN